MSSSRSGFYVEKSTSEGALSARSLAKDSFRSIRLIQRMEILHFVENVVVFDKLV